MKSKKMSFGESMMVSLSIIITISALIGIFSIILSSQLNTHDFGKVVSFHLVLVMGVWILLNSRRLKAAGKKILMWSGCLLIVFGSFDFFYFFFFDNSKSATHANLFVLLSFAGNILIVLSSKPVEAKILYKGNNAG